jgi:hypothetical protein
VSRRGSNHNGIRFGTKVEFEKCCPVNMNENVQREMFGFENGEMRRLFFSFCFSFIRMYVVEAQTYWKNQ